MTLIYTTFPNDAEAQKIARALVDEKLAACAVRWPIASVYQWKGEVREEGEVACLIKTAESNRERVMNYIAEHHSYDVPCIIEVATGSVFEKYERYLNGLEK